MELGTLFRLILFNSLLHVARGYLSNSPHIITFWGQDPALQEAEKVERALNKTCGPKSSYSTVVLGFVSKSVRNKTTASLPPMHCVKSTKSRSKLSLYCPEISKRVEQCKQNKKKVLIGVGGPNETLYFDDPKSAQYFAKKIWNWFLGGTEISDMRPFGGISLDGVNIFLKDDKSKHVDVFLQTLDKLRKRSLDNRYMYTMSVPCNAPEAYFGEGKNKLSLEKVVPIVKQIYVRYSGKQCCKIGPKHFRGELQNWKKFSVSKDRPALFVLFPRSPHKTMTNCFSSNRQLNILHNIMKKEEKGKVSSKYPKFESLRNLTTVTALQSPVQHHPLLQPEGGKNDVESEIDPSDAPVSSQLGKVGERSTRKLDPSDAPISSQQLTRHTVGSLVNTTLSRAAFKLLQDVAELRRIQRTIKLASQLSSRIQAEEKSPKSTITTDILKRFLKKKLLNNNTDIDLYLDEPGDEFKNLKDKIHNTDGIDHGQGESAMDRTENIGDIAESQTTDDIMNIDNIQSLFRKHHTPGEKKKLRASLKSAFDKMQTDIENTASVNENEAYGSKNESEASLNPLNELLLTYLLKHDKSLESYTSSSPTSRVDDIDMADDALVVKPDATNELNHVFAKNNSIDDLDMKDDAERKLTPLATSIDHQKRKMNASESYIDALLKGVQSEVLDIKNYSKKEHTQIVDKKDESKVEDESDESKDKNERKVVSENEVNADDNEDELKANDDSEMSGSGEAVTANDTNKETSIGDEKEETPKHVRPEENNDEEEQHFKIDIKEMKGKAKDLVTADAKPDDQDFEREVSEILEKSKLKSDEDATVSDVKQILENSQLNSDPNEEEKTKLDDIEEILDESKLKSDVSGDEEAKVSDVKDIVEKSQDEANSEEEEAKVSDVKQILSHHTKDDKKDTELNAAKETGLNESKNKETGARPKGPKKKGGGEITTSKENGFTESPDYEEGDVKPDDAEDTHPKVSGIRTYDKKEPEPQEADMKEAESIDTNVGGAKTLTGKAFKTKPFFDRGKEIKSIKNETKNAKSKVNDTDALKINIKSIHLKKNPIKTAPIKVLGVENADTNKTDNVKEENSVDMYVDESENVAKEAGIKKIHEKSEQDSKGEATTENKTKESDTKQGDLKESDAKQIGKVSTNKDGKDLEVADIEETDHVKPVTKQASTKKLYAKQKYVKNEAAGKNDTDIEAAEEEEYDHIKPDIKHLGIKESDARQKNVEELISAKDNDIKESTVKDNSRKKPVTKQGTIKESDRKQKKVRKVVAEVNNKAINGANIKENEGIETDTKQSGMTVSDAKQKKVKQLASAKEKNETKETNLKENDRKKTDSEQVVEKEFDAKQEKIKKLVTAEENSNIESGELKENDRIKPNSMQTNTNESNVKPKKSKKVVSEKESKHHERAEEKEVNHVEPDTKQTGLRESNPRKKKVYKVVTAKDDKEVDVKERKGKHPITNPSSQKEPNAREKNGKKMVAVMENKNIREGKMKGSGSGRKNPDTKQSGAKESDARQKKIKKVVAASKSTNKQSETKLEKMEDARKIAAKDKEKKDEDVKADIMDDAEKALAKDEKMANKQIDGTEVSGEAEDVKVIDISHNTESFEDLLFKRLEELKSLRKLKRVDVKRKSDKKTKKKKKKKKKKRKHHKRYHSAKKHKNKVSSKYFRLLSNNSEIDQETLRNLKTFHKALKDEDSKSTSKEDFENEINKFYELQKEATNAENERDLNGIHNGKDKKVYYLKGNYTPIYFMKQLYENKFDDKVTPEKKASPNKKNEETHESLDAGLMPFIGDKDLAQEPPIFEQPPPQLPQLDARGGQPDPLTQQNPLPRPQVSEQYSPISQTPDVSPSMQSGNATSVTTNNSTISANDVRTNLIEDVLSLLHKSVKVRKEKLEKKKAKKRKRKKRKHGKKNKHHQREHIVKKLAKLIVDKEQEEIKQLEMVREKLRMVKNASVSDSAPSTPPDTQTETDPLAPGIILDGDPLAPITSNSQPTAASVTNLVPSIATDPSSSLLPPPVGNSVMSHGQELVPETTPLTNNDNVAFLSPLPDDVAGMTMTAGASLFDAPTAQNGLTSGIPSTATAGANPGSALYNSYSGLDPLYSSKILHNYTLPSPNMVAFQEQQRNIAAEGCAGEMVFGKRCIPSAKNAYIGLGNQHHVNEAFVKHDPNSLTALESVPLEKQYNYGVTSMFDMPMISPETGKPIDVSLLPKYKLHGEENVAQYVTAQNRKDAAAMLVAHAQQMYGKSKTTPASAISGQLVKNIGDKSSSVGNIGPENDTENLNKAISMYNNALKTISGIVAKYNKSQTDGSPLGALQKPITSPLFSGSIPSIEQLNSFSKATAETSTTSTTESPFMKVVGTGQSSSVSSLNNASTPFNNNKMGGFELNDIQKSLRDAAANMKVEEKSSNNYNDGSSHSLSESSSVSSSGDVSSSVSSNSDASPSSAETPPAKSSTLLPASNDPSNVERSATEMPAFDLSYLQTIPDNSESKENSQHKNTTAATKSEAPSAVVTTAVAAPSLMEKVTKPHDDLFTTNIPHARVALPQIPKEHDEHLKTLFPYNAYYPRAPPIKMSRSEQEGNHFKAEYTKYKLGLKRLADIIGKYTYKLGKIEKMNAYKGKTNNLVNKLATNANVFEGNNVDDVTGLGTYPPIPFTYSQLAKPSNAMLQYLSPTEHLTVRRTLSPTNDMQSKHTSKKNKKTQQTLEDELKSISMMLEKSLSYQSLPDTIISQFTGGKRHGNFNTPYPVTQMGRYAIKGYKRHNEMVVPEWANPLKRPSPPKDWDEQYADNVKYLKLLQGDMQSSVDRFNQDIIKQQKMNQSQVDTSKKYPFKFPEDELDRLNKDAKFDSIETDMSKYMVGGRESSSLLKNISAYPFVDNDNATLYPQESNQTTEMHNVFIGNTTQDVAANVSDSFGLSSNDSAFSDDGSGVDVAQIQYFSNDDINRVDEVNLPLNATSTNQTFIAPALLTNSSVNDVSQRHMDGNVNVKGNMDLLKSLMNQMQQDIDNANAALEEQNQKKLEEKIIEDKERKEKDAKEAAESDQRHNVNNTNSISFNTSTDNNNNNNNENNDFNNSTSSIDNKDYGTETYTKDESNDTTDATSGTVRSDLDKVKALITQMQQDVFNTNAAIYAQGHQNPWPTQLAQSQIEQDIFNTNAALYKLKQSIKKKPKENTDKTS